MKNVLSTLMLVMEWINFSHATFHLMVRTRQRLRNIGIFGVCVCIYSKLRRCSFNDRTNCGEVWVLSSTTSDPFDSSQLNPSCSHHWCQSGWSVGGPLSATTCFTYKHCYARRYCTWNRPSIKFTHSCYPSKACTSQRIIFKHNFEHRHPYCFNRQGELCSSVNGKDRA